MNSLYELLERSASERPDKPAIVVPGGEQFSYSQLNLLSDRVRDRLHHMGVLPGDRVGLRLRKSIAGVAVIFGILKAGAAYVPIDARSPASRAAFILSNCRVKAVVTERNLHPAMISCLESLGISPSVLIIADCATADSLRDALDALQMSDPAPPVGSVRATDQSVAYILYTSGSTGLPKGVTLSHRNAFSFVDWCSEKFGPSAQDVFSSHAPFHFDLSIFDIYVSIKHGGTLILISEDLGKSPLLLARAIASARITIWYSTPSILGFLAGHGKMDRYDYSALRLVLFAGEVFPLPHYLSLRRSWRTPRFFNLYGPTETNVCTWYEVPDEESVAQMSTFPIGHACHPNLGRVVDEHGLDVPGGSQGELVIAGPNVMLGYWDLPEQNRRAFLHDADGRKWYRTGDIVFYDKNLGLIYIGRRDRMVKRRGHRVELGEVEAGLLRNEIVREAAVVAIPDPEDGVRLAAFVSGRLTASLTRGNLRADAMNRLPPYMIPDRFVVLDYLPRTSTDKLDYEAMKRLAAAASVVDSE